MKSPHEKALQSIHSKPAGKEYKKGVTKGDLAKHKRVNFKIRAGWKDGLDHNPKHQ